jgi:hypothetical protein
MTEIQKQVRQAQRRLALGRFGRNLIWALFFGLIVAMVGSLVPKFWYLEFLRSPGSREIWNYGWIISGAGLAVLVALGLSLSQIPSQLSVATEIDKRFRLKERLSSALNMKPEDADTLAGRALLQDANHRAEAIEVCDEFRFQPSARALLPLIPVLLIIILLFVPNATQPEVLANESAPINKKDIQVMIEEARKKKEDKRAEAAKGLKAAKPEMQELERKFDELLDDQSLDKKNALVKLNDIQKQIEDRKRKLGSSSELKDNLNRLKDAAQGPAKELADALSKGDMPEAQKAIRELAKKLKEGKLNEMEAEKLAKDLDAMAKELKKIAEKKKQEQQDLEQQLQKALEKGDLDKAAQLQEKIDRLKQRQQQQEKLQKMADQLQKCADCMKKAGSPGGRPKDKGNPREGGASEQQAQAMKEAGESLEDIADQLEKMQGELEELEDLEDFGKLAEGCKGCMNGCKEGEPNWQDWGQGEGRGGGKRAIEKNDTRGFKAKVKGQLQQGETVITGSADGDNITGRSTSQARKLVAEAMSRDSDPLENQVLPKAQREHAQQYFEALRKNQ